ncbi:MAG TPA: MerR family transcriptional regulator [Ktedonobacteraceae bacterium]|jgi:DNA-binding transcriptional MerR regulator
MTIHHLDFEQEQVLESSTVETYLTIGDLARLTGVPIKAIRYYEHIGLLPPASRGENGYRYYTQADVHRVNLLRRLRFLGTSLHEAKPLLDATTTAPCQVVQRELLDLVEQRLAALDREIAELIDLRTHVQHCQQRLATSPVTREEPFTRCFDGSCLACSRLSPEDEQRQRARHKASGFAE